MGIPRVPLEVPKRVYPELPLTGLLVGFAKQKIQKARYRKLIFSISCLKKSVTINLHETVKWGNNTEILVCTMKKRILHRKLHAEKFSNHAPKTNSKKNRDKAKETNPNSSGSSENKSGPTNNEVASQQLVEVKVFIGVQETTSLSLNFQISYLPD